jgi:acetyltransferase
MANLDSLFKPKSIAIIGASSRTYTLGNRIMVNLKRYGFKGPVYPVNPKGETILDIPSSKSILDVPGEVDIAHVIVRANLVGQTLEDCAQKGVKAAIINTSGFKEVGPEGAKMEEELVEIGKRTGLRLFGPNCQGVMNSDPDVNLYSNFTFATMRPGHVSIVAQGGGVAEVINNYFGMHHIGQRMYASNGNACDISVPEIIEYYGEDPETHVIVLHAESFSDPREFLKRVRPVAAKKPILALKSGTTEEGARAVSSHTGGLMESDTTTDVLFDKCGVLRFSNLAELCEAAQAFSMQKVPSGNRVGMVTNAGSPAIIVTDELVKAGLEVPDLSDSSKEALKEELQAIASIANPIDMMATASGKEFGASLKALLNDDNIDAAVVCFMTPFFVDTLSIAQAIEELAAKTDKTLIAVAMTNPAEKPEWQETIDRVRAAGVPVYYFPEVAARVLYHMDRYRALRDRPSEQAPNMPFDEPQAFGLVKSAVLSPDGFMSAQDASALLEAYDVLLVEEQRAAKLDDLKAAAERIGYPVVLKAEAPTLIHKTDQGGVVLGIADQTGLEKAFQDLSAKFPQEGLTFLIQRQLEGGMEVIVGGVRSKQLGPMIMFGLGGIHVEVFKDVVFGLAPLNLNEAGAMVNSINAKQLLDGFRGQKGIDKIALIDIVLRVSRMFENHPTIAELDLNPIIAYPEDRPTLVVDARIRLDRE